MINNLFPENFLQSKLIFFLEFGTNTNLLKLTETLVTASFLSTKTLLAQFLVDQLLKVFCLEVPVLEA